MFKLIVIACSFFSTVVYTPDTVPVEPGTYPVQVAYKGDEGEVSKVINVTVGSDNYITDGEIAIDAHDITTTYDQDLTVDYLIQSANAKAWNTTTNESYKIISAKVEQNQETVTFETILGVKTTVKLSIITREELYDMYIAANNGEFIQMQVLNNYVEYIVFFALIFAFALTFILFIFMQVNANKRFKEIDMFYN